MVKVKAFSTEVKIFHTKQELTQLDELVNKFIADNGIKQVISVRPALRMTKEPP